MKDDGERMTNMVWSLPSEGIFQYEGRIDQEQADAPVFVYPGSFFRFRVKGLHLALAISNQHGYFENTLGILVDGEYRGKVILHDGEKTCGESREWYGFRLNARDLERFEARFQKEDCKTADVRIYELDAFLDGNEHEITVFKRMDTCHYFSFHGAFAPSDVCMAAKSVLPERRIEVFGDSVSCGEVSEAIGRCGGDDPQGHNGIYSNSYYSYSWILARKLDARIHITSQGGIALLDGEGYFNEPNRLGMISSYDKIQINPSLGERKEWELSKYVPHVILIAIGQNDHHPENYMVEDYEGEKAKNWRKKYREFIEGLRRNYPKAQIVLTTTILGHDVEWDNAIEQVCRELGDAKVCHFLYSKNGCGTTGHIRRPEAEQMASEMKAFLDSLGPEIWLD